MKKLFWHRSIQFQIGMIVIITLASTMSILGYFQYTQTRRDVNERLLRTAEHIASKLSINLVRPVYSLAPEFAFQILSAEMTNTSVYAIYVYEKEKGKIREELFAGYVRDSNWIPVQPSILRSQFQMPVATQLPQGELVMSRDIMYSDDGQDHVIGQVDIHLTRKFAKAEIRRAAIIQVISTMLVTTLIGTCLLLLLQSITRPIITLTKAATEIAKGNFDHSIDVHVKNEIGVLAESFVRMGNSIKQQIHTLKAENAERLRAEAELHQNQQQLQAILDNSTAVIYLKDIEGKYLLINHQYERLFHVTKRKILGKTDYDIFPKEMADAFQENDQRVIDANAPQEMEEYAPHDDGVHAYISIKVPMYDAYGKIYGVCGISTDITERKKAEDLLKHYNKQLEQEVEHRTQDLKSAKEQALEAKEAAEAANRAKSTFLANMSHELRTPLHGILGFAQQLERDATLTDSQHQGVDIIYRNGEHLLTLLNDILDFTKIEANILELHPEQFALPSLIRQLADMAQLNAKHKGLSFAYEAHGTIPHIVYGDQKRLRQILLNLLGNAIRFTEQGKVIFRVTKLENRDSKLETRNLKLAEDHFQFPVSSFQFQIEDTGIGISSEQLETIFQPFQQADPYKLQEGSTGLGLAISQRLVKMMGSQIHVISIEGQGTIFWFELELPVVETLMPQRSPESLSPPEKKGEIDEPIPPLSALLPADWIATLRQAAEESDIEVLFQVIAHIREREPGLADALARLAEDFEYDEILRLIQDSV